MGLTRANDALKQWLGDVAKGREHADLGERPSDRLRLEPPELMPYHHTVIALALPTRRGPTSIESLQHLLSTYYDALGMNR